MTLAALNITAFTAVVVDFFQINFAAGRLFTKPDSILQFQVPIFYCSEVMAGDRQRTTDGKCLFNRVKRGIFSY